MKMVIFTHPDFLKLKSMQRFSRMIAKGMKFRGHEVEIWSPRAIFFKLQLPRTLKKWMGYIDQYVIFPLSVKNRIRLLPENTLFVFADHALGPWVPLAAGRPNVIHCHDFLAQRSGLDQIYENPVTVTGKKYQSYIRKGYSKGSAFVSVSEKTRADLEWFLKRKPEISEVIYNGLDPLFKPFNVAEARSLLTKKLRLDLLSGYILHVGGNQWYKNRTGVVDVYNQWRTSYQNRLPLLMIGESPSDGLLMQKKGSGFGEDIHLLTNSDDDTVRLAYAGATVFFFPSLAEGFGWPVAEAMASGTLVITTNEAPMSEVAGDAAFLVERRPETQSGYKDWLVDSAAILQNATTMKPDERAQFIEKGLRNIQRFELEAAMDKIENIYTRILNDHSSSRTP